MALLLGACSGSNKAPSQADVQKDVENTLIDNGYIAGPDAEPVEVSPAQAEAIGECVGAGLFDPDQFTKDERQDVTHPGDGTPPPDELVERFDTLFDGCVADELEVGPTAPTDDEDS